MRKFGLCHFLGRKKCGNLNFVIFYVGKSFHWRKKLGKLNFIIFNGGKLDFVIFDGGKVWKIDFAIFYG